MIGNPSNNKRARLSGFLPLLIPVAIIIAFVSFYRIFLFCNGPDAKCSLIATTVLHAAVKGGNDTKVRSYVAKATWTLVNGVHAIACLAALIIAAVVMNQALSDYGRQTRATLISLAIALAAFVALAVSLFFDQDTGAPGPQLLRATVGQVLPTIFIYIRGFDALSLVSVFSLCCAACAILWKPAPNPNQPQDPSKELRKRHRLLRYVLFTSAALLVIGVLRLSTTLNWGASFIPSDSEVGKFIGPLVSGIVSSLGTVYTLLIAGMYFPAVLLLRARTNELAEAANSVAPDAWLSENGLTLSSSAWLPRIVAILAPLMAGPFIDIIKNLIGTSG
jgi:hypothetical protein